MASLDLVASVPGVFYSRPAPDQPPYKSPGDHVRTGDVVGLVEVMKTFIEIRAERDGRFVAYAVGDEEMVMAGDAICALED